MGTDYIKFLFRMFITFITFFIHVLAIISKGVLLFDFSFLLLLFTELISISRASVKDAKGLNFYIIICYLIDLFTAINNWFNLGLSINCSVFYLIIPISILFPFAIKGNMSIINY